MAQFNEDGSFKRDPNSEIARAIARYKQASEGKSPYYQGAGWNIGASNRRIADEEAKAREEARIKEALYQKYKAKTYSDNGGGISGGGSPVKPSPRKRYSAPVDFDADREMRREHEFSRPDPTPAYYDNPNRQYGSFEGDPEASAEARYRNRPYNYPTGAGGNNDGDVNRFYGAGASGGYNYPTHAGGNSDGAVERMNGYVPPEGYPQGVHDPVPARIYIPNYGWAAADPEALMEANRRAMPFQYPTGAGGNTDHYRESQPIIDPNDPRYPY